jgi:predicted permease
VKPTRAERIAGLLLRCYPPAFRREFGPEILQFVRTAAAESSTRLCWTLARDAMHSLPREWRAALASGRGARPFRPHPPPGEPMHTLLRDLAHAARFLATSPMFTIAAVLTLALGIGANTAIFTLAETVLLTPVQVRDPQQLYVWSWTSSYPDVQEYQKRKDVFDAVAAVSGTGRLSLVINGTAELAQSAFVSGATFAALGVRAAHGRTLVPSDDVRGGTVVGVVSHDYWRRRFADDPQVIGTTIRANGKPVTIVGVLQKGFRGVAISSNPDIYLPASAFSQVQTGFFSRQDALTNRGFVWLRVIGRLRTDVTVAQANERMTALYAQLHPPRAGDPAETLDLTPLLERALGRSGQEVRTFVALLIGVVAMTLVIGCTNLANLLLAKAAGRRREIGVRLALGASRRRIVQQMLTESVLLSAIGGFAGLAVAAATLNVLSSYELPGGLAIGSMGLEIDRQTIAITAGLSFVTGLLFGIMPAWRASRTDVLVSLRDSSRGSTSRGGVRNALLGTQVAICLVLLAGTGLFARTLQNALTRPLGFDAHGVVNASVNVGLARYAEPRARAFYAEAIERLRALPQVSSAAWASMIPTRGSWVQEVTIHPSGSEKATAHVNVSHVGPGFFKTIGTRVISGREFDDSDSGPAQTVAVINQAMAKKYWGDRDPIGGRVGGPSAATVIGVVENIVDSALVPQAEPFVYFAFNQSLSGPDSLATDRAHLVVRTPGEPADTIALVSEQLRAIDPELPLFDLEPFADRVAAMLMPQRLGFTLFAFFSTIAVCLAAIGIFGVASYVAALRRREIGVRVALGATASQVRRMMVGQGSRPVSIGIAVGLGLALFLSRTMEAFLVDVSPFDPATFAVVTAFLAVVALAAWYLPARRASRMDPVTALRED